jgi:hypothetical protein
MRKLLYLSDGPAAQYKNRNIVVSMINHKNDFGIAMDNMLSF